MNCDGDSVKIVHNKNKINCYSDCVRFSNHIVLRTVHSINFNCVNISGYFSYNQSLTVFLTNISCDLGNNRISNIMKN